MNLQNELLKRVNGILLLAEKVKEAYHPMQTSYGENDFSDLQQIIASSAQFVLDIYGPESVYFKEIRHPKMDIHSSHSRVQAIEGILAGVKVDIEEGYIGSIQNEILAEFSGDYLEMATHLNSIEGLHIASAVIAGATLEERVRQLSRKHLGTDSRDNGAPESVENLNMKLRDFYWGKINYQRLVTKEYGNRNEAAHGRWNGDKDEPKTKEIHKEVVKLMISNVHDFIKRNPI